MKLKKKPNPQVIPSAPAISVFGTISPQGYMGYVQVSISSSASFVNYTTNGVVPSCFPEKDKPQVIFVLAKTAEVAVPMSFCQLMNDCLSPETSK
jgi:hypothetical protein